jgi:hypothetical protein
VKAASHQRARRTRIVVMRAIAAALATAVVISCGPTTGPREADLGGAQPGRAAQASAPTSSTAKPGPTATTPTPTPEPPTIRPSTTPPTTPPPPPALRFTSVTSPVSRGATASAAVATNAGTSCSIVVTYKSGPSTAAGLSSRVADGAGAAGWSWTVGGNTTPGDWPIDVTCGGVRVHTTFTVR